MAKRPNGGKVTVRDLEGTDGKASRVHGGIIIHGKTATMGDPIPTEKMGDPIPTELPGIRTLAP